MKDILDFLSENGFGIALFCIFVIPTLVQCVVYLIKSIKG